MEPFRAPQPTCTRCGAPRPDHLNGQGEVVCRACATLTVAEVQLSQGRRSGVAGAIVGLVFGAALLVATSWWTVSTFNGHASRGETGLNARLSGAGLGVSIVILVVSWRNFQTFKARKR